ncbi:hypothetical protein [Bradyrhizobium sp. BR 10289]|uniref:hypothetical protein n=1 Tax=Bradyrhizobium sp. BR 10289 TaxID=2749993 RepID=UPI001C64B5EF|nr:hypothetical protein [Bradyrhizobium sp. BR 10289]MBW7970271.1 hypothetical protein [Bradyrhizobium sp. BR 10289]
MRTRFDTGRLAYSPLLKMSLCRLFDPVSTPGSDMPRAAGLILSVFKCARLASACMVTISLPAGMLAVANVSGGNAAHLVHEIS